MMMPANYSVIAENEMTYVNGGALIDCFAPLMNSSNWKTFNTNLIGELFGGTFSFEGWGDTIQANYWKGFDSVNNGLNTVLSWVGALGAIYTLGTAEAKTLQADKVLTVSGKAWA